MPTLQITFIKNAGIDLRIKDTHILIDALHNQRAEPFSTMSDEEISYLLTQDRFARAAFLFVTHQHKDHCSLDLLKSYLEKNPNSKLLMPGLFFPQQLSLSGSQIHTVQAGIDVKAKRFTHDGKQYIDVINYGAILTFEGVTILFLGDCSVAEKTVADFVKDVNIDIAILNFPWITLRRGRDMINDVIRPLHTVIVHLPDPLDDVHNFIPSTQKFQKRMNDDGQDVSVMTKFLQTIEFTI